MSLNIQVVADKTNFSNHFNDVITLPSNSKVALTKCEMTIPMFIQNILLVPNLSVAQRGFNALEVNIDGITNNITWLELYTAYAQYPQINKIEPNLNQTTFFSGDYPFFTNNKMFFDTNPVSAVRDGDKPTFFWVIAKAISNKFDFYDCVNISPWVQNGFNIGNEEEGSSQLRLVGEAGHVYNNCNLIVANQPQAKLNVFYNPNKVATKNPDLAQFSTADLTNWTNVFNGLENSSGQECFGAPQFTIDMNGGYTRFQPNLDNAQNSSNIWCGYNLSGLGNAGDSFSVQNPTQFSNKGIIDIGVDFTWESAPVPVQTQGVYRIIDGGYWNGTNYEPNYVPWTTIKRFNNHSDFFYIVGQRSNETNGDPSNIIFQLYQGSTADITQDTLIYTYKTRIRDPNTSPQLIFACDTSASAFDEIAYIPAQVDSLTQSDLGINATSGFVDTFKIQPLTTTDYGASSSSVRNFWSALGMGGFTSTSALPSLNRNTYLLENEGTPLNKILSWNTNYKDEDSSNTNISYYWLGKRDMKEFYTYGVSPNGIGNARWNVNLQACLTYLPKHINCYINNLDIKNFQGSYSSLAGAESQTGITRLVATIPLPDYESSVSQDIEIEYETFNPYYRPLSNPNIFTINQLMIEISFKDFETDQRETIDYIKGLVRCEFNILGGINNIKRKMENDLLPYI